MDQCGSYMQVNTPVLVKGRLSVRDEKPPQIMCDSLYPLESGLPPMEQPSRRPAQRESTIYLRFPSADSPAFRTLRISFIVSNILSITISKIKFYSCY